MDGVFLQYKTVAGKQKGTKQKEEAAVVRKQQPSGSR